MNPVSKYVRQRIEERDKAREERMADINALPMPLCGDKEKHYYWTGSEFGSCPACGGIKQAADQRAKENDYIDRLAKAIARELKEIQ